MPNPNERPPKYNDTIKHKYSNEIFIVTTVTPEFVWYRRQGEAFDYDRCTRSIFPAVFEFVKKKES